jgi:pimeloyl-[acyl-carrier protein] methyl ester esterase
LLLVHGWALDARLWDKVRPLLGEAAQTAVVLERGYYGAPPTPPPSGAGPWLGVGHSLGALELLASPPQTLAGLVVIDGFARFSAGPDFSEGVGVRVLERMRRRLSTEPEALVADFLAGAGGFPPEGPPHSQRLDEGLARLASLDGRAAAARLPIWRLHAEQDPIAPLSLADTSFGVTRARRTRPGGDHLSPRSAPQACADLIQEALACLP